MGILFMVAILNFPVAVIFAVPSAIMLAVGAVAVRGEGSK